MADCVETKKAHLNAGADVTHPRGFNVTEPSVAAVVASMDGNTARYAARVRLQGHRVEIIQARALCEWQRATVSALVCIVAAAPKHFADASSRPCRQVPGINDLPASLGHASAGLFAS